MTSEEAAKQLKKLEPVPPPPPGPTYEHIIGNQIRWTAKVLRYERYRWRLRRLQKVLAKQHGGLDASDRTSQAWGPVERPNGRRVASAVLGFWLR